MESFLSRVVRMLSTKRNELTAFLMLAIYLFGCQKEIPENSEVVLNEELSAKIASTTAALNPVFVFQRNYNVGKRI